MTHPRRPPLSLESLAASLAPEVRQRLAAIQRDPRAAQALTAGKAPRAPSAPTGPALGAVVPSVSARGPVVVLQLKGLALASTPNAREHWTARAERSRDVRALVARALEGTAPPPGPWTVAITRSGPRVLDSDNLAASCKALRDALAAWMGVDDGPSAPVAWTYAQARGGYGVSVVVSGRG